MINCPKCCRHIDDKTTVCECGAILFGEVTNIAPWETETVFRAATVATRRKLLPVIGVVALITLGTLLAALPRLSTSIGVNQTVTETVQTIQTHDQTRSDLIPSDGLIEPSPFEFIPDEKTARPAVAHKPLRPANDPAPAHEPATSTLNTLDAQLVAEGNESTSKTTTDPRNCEPDVTSSLRKPESTVAEVKKSIESKTSQYLLGPRGGCFIVTAGGGKKYVDRSLCAPAAAAARQ